MSAVESLLVYYTLLILEAWIWMWGCYKAAVDRPPPPSRVDLSTMTAERGEIYQNVPLPGYPIPVGDLPFLVDDDISEDEEITWALCRLCLNRFGGPSGI